MITEFSFPSLGILLIGWQYLDEVQDDCLIHRFLKKYICNPTAYYTCMEIPSFPENYRLYFTSRLFHHLYSIDSDAQRDNISGIPAVAGYVSSSISRKLVVLRQ